MFNKTIHAENTKRSDNIFVKDKESEFKFTFIAGNRLPSSIRLTMNEILNITLFDNNTICSTKDTSLNIYVTRSEISKFTIEANADTVTLTIELKDGSSTNYYVNCNCIGTDEIRIVTKSNDKLDYDINYEQSLTYTNRNKYIHV